MALTNFKYCHGGTSGATLVSVWNAQKKKIIGFCGETRYCCMLVKDHINTVVCNTDIQYLTNKTMAYSHSPVNTEKLETFLTTRPENRMLTICLHQSFLKMSASFKKKTCLFVFDRIVVFFFSIPSNNKVRTLRNIKEEIKICLLNRNECDLRYELMNISTCCRTESARRSILTIEASAN